LLGLIIIFQQSFKWLGLDIEVIEELVDKASNGEEAVKMVKELHKNGKEYGLIITDCSMPQLDGYKASSQIRIYCTTHNI